MPLKLHVKYFGNKNFIISLLSAVILLASSLVANFYAGIYATEQASNSVTDIVLSNTRVYDVDSFFVYGSIIFWIFIAFLCLLEPKRLPFTFKSIALFVFIRAIFVSLTHLGPFPTHVVINSNVLSKFTFGGDFFFSGHTGLPFLLALIFWDNSYLRVLFTVTAVLFGAIVLMGHLHYTIDVVAAFFITYSIFHIACWLFTRDYRFFHHGVVEP